MTDNRYSAGTEPPYPHEAYCNADRSKPIGCEACSCRAGREIKRLRSLLDADQAASASAAPEDAKQLLTIAEIIEDDPEWFIAIDIDDDQLAALFRRAAECLKSSDGEPSNGKQPLMASRPAPPVPSEAINGVAQQPGMREALERALWELTDLARPICSVFNRSTKKYEFDDEHVAKALPSTFAVIQQIRTALAARPPAAPVDQERLAELQNEAGMYKSLYENAIAQRSSAGTTDAGCGAAVITPWAVEGSSRDWFGDLNERIGKGLNAPLEPSADNGDQTPMKLCPHCGLQGGHDRMCQMASTFGDTEAEKAANALKPSARCACVDPYENCEFPDCPQGEDHAETPARAATPDGVENLRAILNDQPYLNSALSVHEIKVILANEGGFMPDEAVLWFRTARGNMGSPHSRPEGKPHG
jgi:hypothetical protein